MTKRLGIIAEDETDVESLKEIVRRLLSTPTQVGLSGRADNGCGQLRRKAARWISELASRGCTAVVVVHDLDRNPQSKALNDELPLRTYLSGQAEQIGLPYLICIPVEEIEAWFWTDPDIVKKIGRGKGRASTLPHTIPRPKEKLVAISRTGGARPRYSPNDNPRWASMLNLDLCTKHCRAFAELKTFVQSFAQ